MNDEQHEHDHATGADPAAGEIGQVAATGAADAAGAMGAAGAPGPSRAATAAMATGGMATGALANEPRTREDALRRLRKIEGQVRGLQRMVEDGRYCADVLTQISSVQQALRAVGKVLMRTHLEHCITDALRSGDGVEAERAYGEVLDLMYRHVR
jgi:CsoR family transcriptional regulator, copper-sensing transcriptional repressor